MAVLAKNVEREGAVELSLWEQPQAEAALCHLILRQTLKIKLPLSRWHRAGICHVWVTAAATHKGLLSCQTLLSRLQLHHPLPAVCGGTEQRALGIFSGDRRG